MERAVHLDSVAKTLARPGRKEPAGGSSLSLSLGIGVNVSDSMGPHQASEQDAADARASSTHPQVLPPKILMASFTWLPWKVSASPEVYEDGRGQ